MLKTLLCHLGFEVSLNRYPRFESIPYYIKACQIDTIIDVGANVGQYGKEVRLGGFKGRIVSFEPSAAAFSDLQQIASEDGNWECHNFALGDQSTFCDLHVSMDSVFNSLLEPSPVAKEVGYGVRMISREPVRVKKLDEVWPTLNCNLGRVMLKIDTQGFDLAVIRGAENCLAHIAAIQMELPMRSMYKGQSTIDQCLELLRGLSFNLVELSKVCRSQSTGELLELDGLFLRTGACGLAGRNAEDPQFR